MPDWLLIIDITITVAATHMGKKWPFLENCYGHNLNVNPYIDFLIGQQSLTQGQNQSYGELLNEKTKMPRKSDCSMNIDYNCQVIDQQ